METIQLKLSDYRNELALVYKDALKDAKNQANITPFGYTYLISFDMKTVMENTVKRSNPDLGEPLNGVDIQGRAVAFVLASTKRSMQSLYPQIEECIDNNETVIFGDLC